jgi:hypothetical protein
VNYKKTVNQLKMSVKPSYRRELTHYEKQGIRIYEDAVFGVIGMFPVGKDSCRLTEFDCLVIKIDTDA